MLRALSGEASLRINGHVVSTAVLTAGDQIELGEQRLLLEAPGGLSPARATLAPETTPAVAEAVANANAKAPRDPGGLYLLIAAAAALASVSRPISTRKVTGNSVSTMTSTRPPKP